MLTWLYLEKARHEEARDCAKKLHKLKSDDPQILVEIAQALERSDLSDALDAYTRAAVLFHSRSGDVSQELWNNMGVLRHRKGDRLGARQCFIRALLTTLRDDFPEYASFASAAVNAELPVDEMWSSFDKNQDATYGNSKNVTVIFNLAKVFEDEREDTKAEHMYVTLLSYYPTYLDCYLRLGEMERVRGNIRLATTLFKEIILEDEKHTGAWSEIGINQLMAGEVQPAQKSFEKLGDKDSYGVIQLCNVYLQSMGSCLDGTKLFATLSD
jgi:RNA polymerase-associated protein CTR9